MATVQLHGRLQALQLTPIIMREDAQARDVAKYDALLEMGAGAVSTRDVYRLSLFRAALGHMGSRTTSKPLHYGAWALMERPGAELRHTLAALLRASGAAEAHRLCRLQ